MAALAAMALFLLCLPRHSAACGSTDYNYMVLYEGERCRALTDFGPVSDAIAKFCDRSSATIEAARKASNETSEAVIAFNGPIRVNSENVNLGPEVKKIFEDSVESEMRAKYRDFNVKLMPRSAASAIFSAECGAATGENAILTPPVLKNIYSKHGIYAVIDATIFDSEAFPHFSFDLANFASDRRDLKYVVSCVATMRFKITRCSDGEILWIDEVSGTAEDIRFFSFFEKSLPLALKQRCTIYSVLSNSSCIK